ncbi:MULTISPECIES: phage tail tape measure protein [Burkholderia cepacia complex]|uniref:Putative phage-related tail transmembrane protein n=1 Tax=Burkholderia orbicola (strain MC0-3) TaxID=406425 RepID=B1JT16_BURO0|nr:MULTISPECIES: membrane protein [Burkholderia cepacia complex]ACA89361.1 putative phage-related tail transmembrane protein [Burkholderia orbicola MC0-3]
MSDRSLRLEVVLKALDQASRPIREIATKNRTLVKELRDSRMRLKELNDTQRRIGEFREMRTGLANTSTKLADAQKKVKELAKSLHAVGPPSQQMIAELAKARQASSKLGATFKKQSASVDELRNRLARAGVDTGKLSQHERTLRTDIAATTGAIDAQSRRLDALNTRQKRIADARAKMGAMRGAAAEMAIGGYAARATGKHILDDLREPLAEAKKVQNERGRIQGLGLGDRATQDAERYVRAMKSPGVAIAENMTLMRDAMSIFADEHHAQMVMPTLAKMKFANEAMFGAGQGHENEEKFMNMLKVIELRGGTKSEAAFKGEANMVQQVLTATGGRVGGDEWRNFIQTGKVAAKQMRQDAFYYQMEPLIQEMGGHAAGTGVQAAYSNLMQGKTTVRAAKRLVELGLVDKKSVEYNTIGNVKRIKPGALIGGDLFNASPFEWLEKVLLPKLKAKGITSDAKILEEFSTIMTNGNGANLFATMYMQREQIHKNEKLNRGAYGIDKLHELGQKQTEGKELIALEKVRNLRTVIGEQVLPVYNRALELTTSVLERLLGFAKEYPNFTRAVAIGAAGLGVLLAVLGTLTIALAGILGPLAIVRFSMSMLGIQGGVLVRALGAVARSLLLVGRVALLNPIGLVIAGIALAALLIVKYWEPIKAFFAGFWQGLTDGLKPLAPLVSRAFAILGAAFAPLKPLFDWLTGALKGVWDWLTRLLAPVDASKKSLDAATGAGRAFGTWLTDIIVGLAQASARFAEFGSNLMSGLVNGITNGLGAVKTAIQSAGDSVVGWFKERLGIHSPSRVFAALGGFTMAGLEQGLRDGQDGPLSTVLEIGRRIVAAGAGIAGAAIAGGAPLTVDNRPPLTAAAAAAARAPAAPAQITIQVYAAPGMDEQALAQKVLQVMRQEQAAQAARERSRLRDRD